VTAEQGWRRKEPTSRRKQSTKYLTARNKNALTQGTIQENKITPNRTVHYQLERKICIEFCNSKTETIYQILFNSFFPAASLLLSACFIINIIPTE